MNYEILINKLTPSFINTKLDVEKYSIAKFMEFASSKVKKTDRILDAGAGDCRYKKYFSHAIYESTDFGDIFDKDYKDTHTFICNLENIPTKNNCYDVIISTQVLEHIENPQQVVNEFYRILKPEGRLFLTVPQGGAVHGDPYNFFNFTKYGIKSLFRKAGFKTVFIKPRGGVFWWLGKRLREIPQYFMYQYLYKTKELKKIDIKPLAFLLFPFYLISRPFCKVLLPFLFFYLDRLDKRQDFTLGYKCYCVKKE